MVIVLSRGKEIYFETSATGKEHKYVSCSIRQITCSTTACMGHMAFILRLANPRAWIGFNNSPPTGEDDFPHRHCSTDHTQEFTTNTRPNHALLRILSTKLGLWQAGWTLRKCGMVWVPLIAWNRSSPEWVNSTVGLRHGIGEGSGFKRGTDLSATDDYAAYDRYTNNQSFFACFLRYRVDTWIG